jgi:hypothetical protein
LFLKSGQEPKLSAGRVNMSSFNIIAVSSVAATTFSMAILTLKQIYHREDSRTCSFMAASTNTVLIVDLTMG